MNRLNIRSDMPCENDLLGFDRYVDTISGMVWDKNFKTPFCIGIFGKWGRGKTSFMQLLQNKLMENKVAPFAVPVWFNPWRYEKEEHLIIPFLKTIENGIEKYISSHTQIGSKILNGLKEAAQRICRVSAAFAYGMNAECKLGPFGIKFDAAKMAAREEEIKSRRLNDAKKYSDELSSIYYDSMAELKRAVDEKDFRLVIFIDDLDRCLPEKAVELLEAIKLFLDIEGYLFIIGVDKDVVTRGISYRYRHFEYPLDQKSDRKIVSAEDYLEKMIQLPIELPPIEPGRKRKYIESLIGDIQGFREHTGLIELGVGENPRSLKRFINLLAFTVRLAQRLKETVIADENEDPDHRRLIEKYFIPVLYIKWTIIVFRFQEVYKSIRGYPGRLIELQNAAKQYPKTEDHEQDFDKKPIVQISETLKKILLTGEQFPESDWLIEKFVYLAEATDISAKDTELAIAYSQSFEPEDMVRIPKGKFLYGDERIEKIIDYDYYIDVFPVTNRQYKQFVDERPNHEVPYIEEEWAEPYNWNQDKKTYPKGMGLHPVVLVTYQDAVDYCGWRSNKEGKEFKLPSEDEWEKAARGVDGRKYPWGEDFDEKRCNTYESGIGKTTEVTRYPFGKSPYEVHDMAGNVWDWTASKEGPRQVLRGGSWSYYRGSARCADRLRLAPRYLNNDVGFRCARTLK